MPKHLKTTMIASYIIRRSQEWEQLIKANSFLILLEEKVELPKGADLKTLNILKIKNKIDQTINGENYTTLLLIEYKGQHMHFYAYDRHILQINSLRIFLIGQEGIYKDIRGRENSCISLQDRAIKLYLEKCQNN